MFGFTNAKACCFHVQADILIFLKQPEKAVNILPKIMSSSNLDMWSSWRKKSNSFEKEISWQEGVMVAVERDDAQYLCQLLESPDKQTHGFPWFSGGGIMII